MKKLLEEFKRYKVDVEGRNSNTISEYLTTINDFLSDMNINSEEELIKVNSQVIIDWLIILSNKNNSPATRNKKLSRVKQLFLFLEEEKEYDIDRKIAKLKYAKTPHKEIEYPEMDSLEGLLEQTSNQLVKAAMAILMNTGMRFSEIMQIKCEDIERGYVIVRGKGNKDRRLVFNDYCTKVCQRYIKGRRKKIIARTNVETDILLITRNGTPLTRQSLARSIKICARKAGLYTADILSPHKFRHVYLSNLLNNGESVTTVKEIAGHSNIATTNVYAHTNQDAIEQAMRRGGNK